MNIPKGFTLFIAVMCFVMAGLDLVGGQYIWVIIMAGLGVWNFNTYQQKAVNEEQEAPKDPVLSCPPHQWSIKAGMLHCTKCHNDVEGKKKK